MIGSKTHSGTATGLLVVVFLLPVLGAVPTSGGATLPLDYEGNDLPQAPWLPGEEAPAGSSVTDNGILTLTKWWTGEPTVAWRVTDLDFTSQTGVTVDLRVRIEAGSETPLRLDLTDEQLYFVYFHIWPDRIQRHRQNTATPEQVYYADFTQWQTLRIEFESRHLRLYLDGQSAPIMDTDITGRYIGSTPSTMTFALSAGANMDQPGGPAEAQVDYIRIDTSASGSSAPTGLTSVVQQPSGGPATVTFSWVSAADEFDFEMERQNAAGNWDSFQSYTIDDDHVLYNEAFLGDAEYRWRVRARHEGGDWSAPSAWQAFSFS